MLSSVGSNPTFRPMLSFLSNKHRFKASLSPVLLLNKRIFLSNFFKRNIVTSTTISRKSVNKSVDKDVAKEIGNVAYGQVEYGQVKYGKTEYDYTDENYPYAYTYEYTYDSTDEDYTYDFTYTYTYTYK